MQKTQTIPDCTTVKLNFLVNSFCCLQLQFRISITPVDQVEFPYYSSYFARLDICAHCGDSEASVDFELKKRFKTVLPKCESCKFKRKEAGPYRKQ